MSDNKMPKGSPGTQPISKPDTYEKRNGGGTRTFQPKKPIKPSK